MSATEYERAVARLEAVSWRGMRPGLERTQALLDALGSPQRGLRGVLVGGTNGKGSVCALVDSVARRAGFRTVLLTKPHLVSYRERIVIDGAWVSDADFASLVDAVSEVADVLPEELQPTGFEMMTAAGILAAARTGAELLVCEVGLGGRLDSTNVLDLGAAAITMVGLDHREHLGDTVEAIAAEKAAIIKPGNVAVTGAAAPALEVIRTRCASVGAELVAVDVGAVEHAVRGHEGIDVRVGFDDEELSVRLPLLGEFQAANAAVAAAVCDALRRRGLSLTAEDVRAGFAAARWPGRMQWIEGTPPLLVDGAHNPDGMAALLRSLPALRGGRRLAVVFAAMRDKDVSEMVRVLSEAAPDAVVMTAPAVERAMSAAALTELLPGATPAPDIASALGTARTAAGQHGLVVVCGSLYLAGEVLSLVEGGS